MNLQERVERKSLLRKSEMGQHHGALGRRVGLVVLASIMLLMATGTFSFTSSNLSHRTIHRSLSRYEVTKTSLVLAVAETDTDGDNSGSSTAAFTAKGAVGMYKQYADYAMKELLSTGWLKEDSSVSETLAANEAPARGAKIESIVRITTKALVPTTSKPLIRYARITLLETIPVDSDDSTISMSSEGIQVLNFVVLPNDQTTLPVLGIDLVSLPGSKHLLLLDAQPMAQPNPHEDQWESWFNEYVRDDNNESEESSLKYAWGGDFPEAVQKYVSKYALWTRLQNLAESVDDEGTTTTSPMLDAIQGDLFDAFQAHLDTYLELLGKYAHDLEAAKGENHQPSYLDYRRNNDPAKPMLNSLYGADWTQSLLDNVLFPRD